MIGSEKTCHVGKNYFNLIYDYYKTAYVLYIIISHYYIFIERSEVKLSVFKNPLRRGKIEKSTYEIKIPFVKKNPYSYRSSCYAIT